MAAGSDSPGLEKGKGQQLPCCQVSGPATKHSHLQGGTFLCILVSLRPEQTLQALVDLVRSARSRNIGVLHPTFSLNREVRDGLQKHLPDNVHQLVSGKIVISLTRVADGENVLVSDFRSKDEVVDVSSLLIWVLSSHKDRFISEATKRGLS